MKKRILCAVLAMLLLLPMGAAAAGSRDAAASVLHKLGLFQGTSGGFRLDETATRAQAVTMLVRFLGEEQEALAITRPEIPFSDVADTAWYAPYVAYAYARGLVNGMGSGKFSPDRQVTGQQYAVMLLRALGFAPEYSAAVSSARAIGIFNYTNLSAADNPLARGDMVLMSYGALHAFGAGGESLLESLLTRGVVSIETVAAADFTQVPPVSPHIPREEQTLSFSVGGKTLYSGMSSDILTSLLGERHRIDPFFDGIGWHVFLGGYKTFVMVGVQNGRVVGFYSNSAGASAGGVTVGKPAPGTLPEFPDNMNVTVFYDEFSDDAVDGILALPKDCTAVSPDGKILGAVPRQLFDLTNAARAGRGLPPLAWSDAAANIAFSHCKSMSEGNFFGHTSPDGVTFADRLAASGLRFTAAGENIAQGYRMVFTVHHAWMNSEGHRTNLLEDVFTHFGAAVTNDLYYAQEFYA